MKKSELPVKTCTTCGLPFTWREKWARCWEEVLYCSERCRRTKTLGKKRAITGPYLPNPRSLA
ncbi:DUF2256 domain-containing protein [Pseudomonas sp. 8 R 14]|uniref:DUF2256 domain-containing protein n=1 Tax=Pseudomonas sp. 8 R 14 TaxID=1844092 RepID=UPI0009F21EA5|nr:DUF2256 domain-containing protein [Pseudomonas sp. 8 R 14]